MIYPKRIFKQLLSSDIALSKERIKKDFPRTPTRSFARFKNNLNNGLKFTLQIERTIERGISERHELLQNILIWKLSTLGRSRHGVT